ncbi:periplasmic binding protein/LacI transcriptional regulator [Klebsiella michiganensis]|uniref:Periplasmic binding protein/LacI transcriptional regulator n=1 Tax=Klebsiella michiganensis TaxID=1134687 RepID=A0A7H4PQS1_9ENTR|nr:periplasmic binding protein/LacI transcriptional regulator [Klebsiella michiganensis]
MPSSSRRSWRPAWEPVLKEAKEAKIPVFLLDRSIDVKDKDLYMTTVTANNVLEGQLIGEWAGQNRRR